MNFVNTDILLEYSIVFVVGILSGIASLANDTSPNLKESLTKAWKVVYMSIYITTIVYLLLTMLEMNYAAKVGLSSLIGFLGFDKAIEVFKKIMEIKNGK